MTNQELKLQLITTLSFQLEAKIKLYQEEWNSLQAKEGDVTKSSAGDKYETSIEMEQQVRGQLENQLVLLKRQYNEIQSIKFFESKNWIEKGNLIQRKTDYIFVLIPFGKIEIDGKIILVIGPNSPLAQAYLKKSKNETVLFQGIASTILDFC